MTAAQSTRREHMDVAVGIVETHGRREMRALFEGLGIIPRREVEYPGRLVDEKDLYAVPARTPALVLVDEFAHTNADGSRHPPTLFGCAGAAFGGVPSQPSPEDKDAA